MQIRQAYIHIKSMLADGGIENPGFEARQLTARAGGFSYGDLLTADVSLDDRQMSLLIKTAEQRLSGEPLQYLLGRWEFYGLPFEVGSGVLIPRPDTELLAEKAIEFCKDRSVNVLDLCSGSGCIAIAIKKHCVRAKVTALEKSHSAIEYLRRNVALNNADITVIQGDLFDLPLGSEQFDLITANPPYLTKDDMANMQTELSAEPETALYGGVDGLDFYRFIIKEYKPYLAHGGAMMLEIGAGMYKNVSEIFTQENYKNICHYKDLCGIIRVVTNN